MKKKLLLLPMFLLVLAACGPSTSSEPVSQNPSTTTETSVTSEAPVTSETSVAPSSEEEESLPPPATESEAPVVEEKTIAQIRDITLDSTGGLAPADKVRVRTSGVVTSIYRGAKVGDNPAFNVHIQDGEKALMLYGIMPDDIAAFGKVGDLLHVEGRLAPYKFLWELDMVEVLSKEEGTAVTPQVVTSVAQSAFAGLDSALVKIEGLSIVSGAIVADDQADNLTLKLGSDEIGAYMHYFIPVDVQQAILDSLTPEGDADNKIDAMDTFTFTGVVGMNNNVYQLSITDATNFSNVVDGGEPVAPTVFKGVTEIRAGMKDASIAVGELVNFEGVVTQKNNMGVLIQQSTGGSVSAIALRGVANTAEIEIGNLVRGTGKVSVYENLPQLDNSGTLTVVSATGLAQTSVEITEEFLGLPNLTDFSNAIVHGSGLVAETDIDLSGLETSNYVNFNLKKGAATFTIRFDKRYVDSAPVKDVILAIKAGYSLEILEGGAYLSWYKTAHQAYLLDASKLIVRNIAGDVVVGTEPEEPAETFLGKYDLSDEVRTAYVSGTKSKYDEGEFATFLMTKLAVGGTETLVSSTGETNVYTAANSFADTGPQFNGIKFGSSKATGTVTLNFAPGTNVVKIVVGAAGWASPNTDTLTIGGVTLTPTQGGVAGTAEELVFEFAATDTVTITANKRIIFSYISVYSE